MRVYPRDINRSGLRAETVDLTELSAEVPNNGAVALYVENRGEDYVVVTIYTAEEYHSDAYGRAQDFLAPGDATYLGPFPTEAYNTPGDCFVAHFSTHEGVFVSALRLPRT